jgi:hypothetical protein
VERIVTNVPDTLPVSSPLKVIASLKVACVRKAVVAIRHRRISFAIVCKSRRGHQAHRSASDRMVALHFVVSKAIPVEIGILAKINTIAIL